MILHAIGRDEWTQALADGEVRPASLADQGFTHCSDFGTAHLPLNNLFAGRTDLVLLVIDPAGLPVRWEPGDPPIPDGPWFPHVYGPIPVSSVIATHDLSPGVDGRFELPPALAGGAT
ncbi:MAG TPA: DUF952 domain-containing protein [Pseudonocardiaceae bacterium]|nr:DUF952 domain-containing protein [Pseudonocardiaceae bacterium]